jgi:L-alanine-DL-glutamate epimerase-like enolase superfamily enzyme
MSAPVPKEKRHRTDLGTKVKSDATLIRVETDNGLTGIGAALGTPPIVAAIVEHELAPEVVGEDPMFSERIYEKMYNSSRSRPALERGVTQADESRRSKAISERTVTNARRNTVSLLAFPPFTRSMAQRS